MNPTAKDHVPALLDEWIALGADDIAAAGVADASARLDEVPGDFRAALVIADDARGRWPNRYFAEFSGRFETRPLHRRGWIMQEGYAMAQAGATTPTLDGDDLAYTRESMAPYLDATDRPTIMACLFGDEIAESLGYPRLGFSRRAGFALALAAGSMR